MKKIPFAFVLTVLGLSLVSFMHKQEFDLEASIDRGRDIYSAQCLSCHMEDGNGMEAIYPPLAKSDYLMADKNRSIREVIHGLSGEIRVNDKVYDGFMPGFALTDGEVSDVLNYIRNSWGNSGDAVTPGEVKDIRQ